MSRVMEIHVRLTLKSPAVKSFDSLFTGGQLDRVKHRVEDTEISGV